MWASDPAELLEGYELIRFTGAISTLELDQDSFDALFDRVTVPFGFRAPARAQPTNAPELTGEAWGEWLDG